MIIRYIANNGKQIEFDSSSNKVPGYIIQTWSGFGSIAATIQTQKAPFQDGQTLIDQLLEPRNLSIQIAAVDKDRQKVFERRREIQNIFNPKLGTGLLQWEQNDGTIYEIEVVPDGSPEFPSGDGQSNNHQTIMINFRAPDPLWRDNNKTETELAQYLGGLSFPFEFSIEFGSSASTKTAINDGDLDTPVSIEIDGPATNPEVINQTTNQKIKIQQIIDSDEKIVINTAFGQKEASLIAGDGTKTNVMHWLTADSEFFKLEVGENKIKYNEESGSSDAGSMKIDFYNRYVGV